MTTSITRSKAAIDSDVLMRLAVERAATLVAKRRVIEKEEERVKRVLIQSMKDAGVKELTVGGVAVAKLTEYDLRTVKVGELLAAFPAAESLVNTTPVTRVELP